MSIINAITPYNVAEACEEIRQATSTGSQIWLGGNATRLPKPHGHANVSITSSAMRGIDLYEPGELTISAAAGTTIAEIQLALKEKDQILPFEPRDMRDVLGTRHAMESPSNQSTTPHQSDLPTLGGAIATGIAGPRRINRGGLRDSILGIDFINGKGEIISAGGRVMKNVTGVDLSKIMCGSYGTLGLIHQATTRLLSAPEREVTLIYSDLALESAIDSMSLVSTMPCSVSGSAYLQRLPNELINESNQQSEDGALLLRIEGSVQAVEFGRLGITSALRVSRDPILVEGEQSVELWRNITNLRSLVTEPKLDALAAMLWIIKTSPSRIANLFRDLENICPQHYRLAYVIDWAGRIAWLRVLPDNPENKSTGSAENAAQFAGVLRKAADRHRAHADWLPVFGCDNSVIVNEVRHTISMLHMQGGSIARLSRQIRASFDPHQIFNTPIEFC